MSAKAVILILNWNGKEHLPECLRSATQQSYDNYEIFLVDNGSTDGSIGFTKKEFSQVRVIETGDNLGFAEGNNVGIRQILQDEAVHYIAVLNNDTQVETHWLAQLVAAAESDSTVGAVASKMMNYYQRDVIDSTGDFLLPGTLKAVTRGAREKDTGQYDQQQECFSARAGACLYTRDMLEDIRLGNDYFDPHYFAYVEDTDLSIRARLRGWKIVYQPTAVVYHKVSATTDSLPSQFKRFHTGRNRLYTAIKDLPMGMWVMAMRGSSQSAQPSSTMSNIYMYAKITAHVLVALPRLLYQRMIIQRRKNIAAADIRTWPDAYSLPR